MMLGFNQENVQPTAYFEKNMLVIKTTQLLRNRMIDSGCTPADIGLNSFMPFNHDARLTPQKAQCQLASRVEAPL